MPENVAQWVTDKVKEAAGEDVTLESRFDHLNVDSLEFVELMQAAEEHYGIQIPDEHFARLNTVGELAVYLVNRLA